MYTVNLIRERSSENQFWVNTFSVDDKVTDPEKAIREAVAEYLETPDGKKAAADTNHDFNWGDVITYVSDSIWKKHSLSLYDNISRDIHVNQDEVLCGSQYDDEE